MRSSGKLGTGRLAKSRGQAEGMLPQAVTVLVVVVACSVVVCEDFKLRARKSIPILTVDKVLGVTGPLP